SARCHTGAWTKMSPFTSMVNLTAPAARFECSTWATGAGATRWAWTAAGPPQPTRARCALQQSADVSLEMHCLDVCPGRVVDLLGGGQGAPGSGRYGARLLRAVRSRSTESSALWRAA